MLGSKLLMGGGGEPFLEFLNVALAIDQPYNLSTELAVVEEGGLSGPNKGVPVGLLKYRSFSSSLSVNGLFVANNRIEFRAPYNVADQLRLSSYRDNNNFGYAEFNGMVAITDFEILVNKAGTRHIITWTYGNAISGGSRPVHFVITDGVVACKSRYDDGLGGITEEVVYSDTPPNVSGDIYYLAVQVVKKVDGIYYNLYIRRNNEEWVQVDSEFKKPVAIESLDMGWHSTSWRTSYHVGKNIQLITASPHTGVLSSAQLNDILLLA